MLIDVYRYINTRFNALYNPVGFKAGMIYSGNKVTVEILDPYTYKDDINSILNFSSITYNSGFPVLVEKEYLILFRLTNKGNIYYGLATTVGISALTETAGFILVNDNGNGIFSSFEQAGNGGNDGAVGGGIMSQNKEKIRILFLINDNNNNSTLSIDILRRVI